MSSRSTSSTVWPSHETISPSKLLVNVVPGIAISGKHTPRSGLAHMSYQPPALGCRRMVKKKLTARFLTLCRLYEPNTLLHSFSERGTKGGHQHDSDPALPYN